MPMFSQIKNSVNGILPKLYSDPDLVSAVTWKKFVSSTFDDTQGMNIDTYLDYTGISAIRLDHVTSIQNTTVFPAQGRHLSKGDIAYLFQFADVPAGASTRDQIQDGGILYEVTHLNPVFGLVYSVEVKGYA